MRIAIVGAGVAGSYLYRLLQGNAHTVDLYDKPAATRCGIRPCAWGTSSGFRDLVSAAGLDPDRYILVESDYVMIDQVRIPGRLMTFDKQRLIRDMRGKAEIMDGRPDRSLYNRIIDATGVSRAMLPRIEDDLVLPCLQYRIRTERPLDNRIRLTSIGYAWIFPLGRGEYHIGCGSLVMDPWKVLLSTGWVDLNIWKKEVICKCRSSIRINSPHRSLPFVGARGGCEIWGVGEAIGCVAPLAGDGIVPGLRSAQLLVKWWDDPLRYQRAVLREFRWMREERKVVDKLRRNEALRLKDAWVLKKNSERMGMEVRVKEANKLLKNLRQPPELPNELPAAP
jgi:flavin-dependent dehydrogenase